MFSVNCSFNVNTCNLNAGFWYIFFNFKFPFGYLIKMAAKLLVKGRLYRQSSPSCSGYFESYAFSKGISLDGISKHGCSSEELTQQMSIKPRQNAVPVQKRDGTVRIQKCTKHVTGPKTWQYGNSGCDDDLLKARQCGKNAANYFYSCT